MGAMSLVRILAVVNLATAKKAATDRKPTRIRAMIAEKIVPPSFLRLWGEGEPKGILQFLFLLLVITSAPIIDKNRD